MNTANEEICPQMNTDKHRFLKSGLIHSISKKAFLSVFICVHLWLISSCSSKPTDVRAVIPADSLVYLETNDLGKAFHAITDNDAFRNAAKTVPDFSVLNGIKLAVAVTGFETKEQQLTEENSVLNFQPRFVAVAETNAWNYQAIGFAENKLGEFINEVYGGEVQLERFPRYEGDYFVWTAQDGRKAYGLVIGSLIFFGNDETAIEKCIAVRKGEAESISKNPKLPMGDFLSSGYVSPDGVAQLANIVGIQLALAAGEEEEVKSFIARVLPEILRNSLKEVTWTATKTEKGIEDKYLIAANPEIAQVFFETMSPSENDNEVVAEWIPEDAVTITNYNLKNPQIAWRTVLLTAQKQTDAVSAKVIAEVSGSLFEPYGIRDVEMFLSAIAPRIITGNFSPEGDRPIVIVEMLDRKKVERSLSSELKAPKGAFELDIFWKSEDGELGALFEGDVLILGDLESVNVIAQSGRNTTNIEKGRDRLLANDGRWSIATTNRGEDSSAKLVEVLSERKNENEPLIQRFQITTEFSSTGLQRSETSRFGLIGSIIEQFAKD